MRYAPGHSHSTPPSRSQWHTDLRAASDLLPPLRQRSRGSNGWVCFCDGGVVAGVARLWVTEESEHTAARLHLFLRRRTRPGMAGHGMAYTKTNDAAAAACSLLSLSPLAHTASPPASSLPHGLYYLLLLCPYLFLAQEPCTGASSLINFLCVCGSSDRWDKPGTG